MWSPTFFVQNELNSCIFLIFAGRLLINNNNNLITKSCKVAENIMDGERFPQHSDYCRKRSPKVADLNSLPGLVGEMETVL